MGLARQKGLASAAEHLHCCSSECLLGQHCTIFWNEAVKLSKVIKGYNLAGCCRDSGGMTISSKNPIETAEKRIWLRLKQFFANDVPQWFLKCISRFILLPLSGRTLRLCRNYSLSHNAQFQLAAEQPPSWKYIEQQRTQSSCPLGKEKVVWSRNGNESVPRNESDAIEVCDKKELRNHRCSMLNKDRYKVRTAPISPLRFHDVEFYQGMDQAQIQQQSSQGNLIVLI